MRDRDMICTIDQCLSVIVSHRELMNSTCSHSLLARSLSLYLNPANPLLIPPHGHIQSVIHHIPHLHSQRTCSHDDDDDDGRDAEQQQQQEAEAGGGGTGHGGGCGGAAGVRVGGDHLRAGGDGAGAVHPVRDGEGQHAPLVVLHRRAQPQQRCAYQRGPQAGVRMPQEPRQNRQERQHGHRRYHPRQVWRLRAIPHQHVHRLQQGQLNLPRKVPVRARDE